jgi:hypothetical protein
VQTGKITTFPIVLLGRDYWRLIDWLRPSTSLEPSRPKTSSVVTDDVEQPALVVDQITSTRRCDVDRAGRGVVLVG